MATIAGSIQGVNCVYKEAQWGKGTREVWHVTANFASYTGSTDDASLAAVGAAIDVTARDGKTSTLRGAIPAHSGDGGTAGVYFTGASVQALTVSSDTLTGNLSIAAGTEIAGPTASNGVGIFVIVDRV